ncbi:hypothetical protein CRUP_026262, partial [Coryphaenoides rupestris]
PAPFAKIRLLDVTTRLIRRSHHVLNGDGPSGALPPHPGSASPSPIHHLTPGPAPPPDLPAHVRDWLPGAGSPLVPGSPPYGVMSQPKHQQHLGGGTGDGGVMGSDRDIQSTASSISLPSVKKAPKKKRRLSLASLFRRRGRESKAARHRSREIQLHAAAAGGLGGLDGIASIESIHSEMCNDKNSAFSSSAAAAVASTSSASGPSSASSSTSKAGGSGGGAAEQLECPLCLLRHSRESFPDIMTCHHRSCADCLRQYLRIEISESRVNISCPECSERFNPHDIRIILGDRALMEKYEEFMLRRWLVADPDCRWCPAPDCGCPTEALLRVLGLLF